ncbi:MAG: HU family DNA-binding protein [Desulfovibrionales bacterium]|nr:HU family DNA-binding protein [Desulfovibrionales bacterium]
MSEHTEFISSFAQIEAYMDKNDLVERLQAEMGYSATEASRIVDALMESLTESLSSGDKITLPGIGTMAVVDRPSRRERHPQPGQEQEFLTRRKVKFSPGKRLKDALMSLDFITRDLE